MARQDFQTFEDRRYRRPDSVETARYQAEARQEVPLPSWWQREAMDARRSPSFDEAYRRSDIVLESPTDPTGWTATGPAAPPIDDRPPAESYAGNRLLTILLFFSGLATSVSLWLFHTQAGAVDDTPTLMLAEGRI